MKRDACVVTAVVFGSVMAGWLLKGWHESWIQKRREEAEDVFDGYWDDDGSEEEYDGSEPPGEEYRDWDYDGQEQVDDRCEGCQGCPGCTKDLEEEVTAGIVAYGAEEYDRGFLDAKKGLPYDGGSELVKFYQEQSCGEQGCQRQSCQESEHCHQDFGHQEGSMEA